VIGPDDVAFNSKGEFYWTSILTGEVSGFNIEGNKIISGNPGIGVNPITFSDDDRLFVAQCFYDNGIFELDPSGATEPRIILDGIRRIFVDSMEWIGVPMEGFMDQGGLIMRLLALMWIPGN
jgi:DNA-binding beta-propeller fold protein YncE